MKLNSEEKTNAKDSKKESRDNSLSGLILLSNLPALIAVIAYLIWRFW